METHEMIALIKAGKGKEHYKEWAKTGPKEVRSALADARQMLEILIDDPDPDVRADTTIYYNECDYNAFEDHLLKRTELPRDIIEGYRNMTYKYMDDQGTFWDTDYIDAFELASKNEPSPTDLELYRYQLHTLGSPIWCKGLTLGETWDAVDTAERGLNDLAHYFMDIQKEKL